MMLEVNCPCCSYPLLRHISSTGMYWYCSHCHQEMPVSLMRPLESDRPITSPFTEEWLRYKNQKMFAMGA
jgi:ribosomal protein L37AE/L43A